MSYQKGYPRLYSAIKRMIVKALLEVPMARAIVRKSGVRFGAGSPYPSAGVLYSFGFGSWRFTSEQWIWTPHEGVLGLWPVPEEISPNEREYPTNVQQSLIQVEGLSYVRATMVLMGGNYSYYGDQVAYLPVYCANLAPLSQADDNSEALAQYICPDGRTLEEWHTDSRVGGAQAYSWPPAGSGVFGEDPNSAGFARGCFVGRWAPPPDGLDASSVLVGVAVISRLPRRPSGLATYESGLVQVQAIPEEWNTEDFQTFYAGQIDE